MRSLAVFLDVFFVAGLSVAFEGKCRKDRCECNIKPLNMFIESDILGGLDFNVLVGQIVECWCYLTIALVPPILITLHPCKRSILMSPALPA